MIRRLPIAVLALAALIAGGCAERSSASFDVHISLGDSVAAGNGASTPDETGFVALLARERGTRAFNVAKAGATTADVLTEQLRRALAPVQAGHVSFITISVGGNDLAALIPNAACVEEPLPAACLLDDALRGVEERLDAMLRALRDANRHVPIVLLAYPNFFSGTGHAWEAPAGRVLPRLNQVTRDVAARYPNTALAEPWDGFDGRGGTLTHVLDPRFDPHPNDGGHRVIAQAFEEALGRID